MRNELVKPTLLIIDDEPSNIKILGEFLREEYKILVAVDGKKALEIALAELPDLILLDVIMPEMDGYEVCRRLKASKTTESIPVIFITALSETKDETLGFSLGAVDYITKPFIPPIVKARLSNHINLKRYRDQIVSDNIELTNIRKKLEEQNYAMKRDLIMAEEVQRHILQQISAPPYLEVATRYLPHSHVSGDLLHGSNGDAGIFDFFIGDATGHGVAAALSTILATMALTEKSTEPSLLEKTLYLNRLVTQHIPENRFLTGIVLRISPDGNLFFVNAGHFPLIIFPADGGKPALFGASGPPLGLFSDEFINYSEESYPLQRDDSFFLFTDGVVETKSPDGEQFGLERTIDFLSEKRSLSLDNTLEALKIELKTFANDKNQEDDITMAAFRFIKT